MRLNEFSKLTEITRKDLFHVTHSSRLPKIRKEGILTNKRANWKRQISGKSYRDKTVNAFDNFEDACRWAAKMDWEFNRTLGSGKVSIVEFAPGDNEWYADEVTDPLTRHAYKGKWWKSKSSVPPSNIKNVTTFTRDLAQKLV